MTTFSVQRLFAVVPWMRILLIVLFLCVSTTAQADDVGCYISTGDNDWVWTSPPVNSEASIEAFFDSLQKIFGVDRIYWRGAQTELICDHYITRPENFQVHAFWEWERYLTKEVGTSEMAVRSARERGMEIWGMTALFDHGAQARVDSAKMGLPSPIEDKLRVEHPEYVPIDRYGIRRQAGPIEFAYPEARKALVERYVELLNRRGYDGMMFYTYVEHCALRFEDEYGYNQPIVDKLKRRYGQDIRKERFDKYAWYRLRGEYVTQFLRELHDAFRQHGKKLGVAIDPQDSHFPAPWLFYRHIRPAGRIYMDWERWVREGIVDEIMVYCNGSLEAALNGAVAATQGTKCSISTIHSSPFPPEHEHFARAGVRRVMAGSYDYFEWGYKEEQPASALDGKDFLAKLRVLRQAAEKKTELPLTKITAATRDDNVLVRRQAIRTLVALEAREAAPAIEAALNDSETGVRCTAADALSKINGPETVGKVFDAVRERSTFQFQNAVVSCLANMPAERTAAIIKGCSDPNTAVRRAVVYALGRGLRRDESVRYLMKALDDPDPYVRFCAAYSLSRFAHKSDVAACLLSHFSDPHPSVRNRIAVSLQSCFQSHSRWLSQRQLKSLEALVECFSQFGGASEYPGANWSFRPIGNVLLSMGPRGREALQRFMDQRQDKRLADLAWRILHAPQTGWQYSTCTEAEAEKGYREHPKIKDWRPVKRPPPLPEPTQMPYLQQSFDDLEPYARGKLGDYLHEGGQWRTLGDVSPSPVIQSSIKRGEKGSAVRLRRGGRSSPHNIEGLRADYRLTTEHAIVKFWVYRASQDAAFAATWKDSGSGRFYIGLSVDIDGRVSVVTKDRTWTRTDANMPHGSWQRVRFDIDGKKLTYTASIGNEKMQRVRENIAIPDSQTYNILTVSPQGTEGSIVYLDDVLVTAPNPAR